MFREAVIIKGGRRLQEIDISDDERRATDQHHLCVNIWCTGLDGGKDRYGDRLRNSSLTVGVV